MKLVKQFNQRTLLPIRSREQWPRTVCSDVSLRRVCVLDVETTGLESDRDDVIEVCAAMTLVDRDGRIVGIQSIGNALQSPGRPLSREISEITGLTDDDLVGQHIERERLTAFVERCDSVIAFNAQFDRPFIERLLPRLQVRPWACAMREIPWRALGFEPGPQNYLLMQAGYYSPAAHRARDDVLSLVQLLDHVCRDGESVIAKLLLAMDTPTFRFEASTAGYDRRHDLRRQGYRWASAASHQLWHKVVPAKAFRALMTVEIDDIGRVSVGDLRSWTLRDCGSEQRMVTEAFAYMRQHADYTMTTHGGIGVDCQILQLAALTADLALPRQLAEAQGPRWKDVRHLDIGLAFKASGKTWHHLSELLLRMGLPAALLLGKADPGVRPEKIDWHKIQEHCELDVLFTSIVLLGWLRLQGHSFLRLATGQLALIESFLRQRPLAVSAPLLRAHADDLQRAVAQELAA